MTFNQANIRNLPAGWNSRNFLFEMQLVSTKELRTLAIRSLHGRSSKENGKGFSDQGQDQFTLIFLDPGSERGRGRTRVDYEQSLFFLSPSSQKCETRKWPC